MLRDLLYTTLLGPVLLVQGMYVKKNTPELPEPAGERSGIDGDGPKLRILIIGDSAAAGVGVEDQIDALSGQLRQVLGKHYCLHWRLIARTGLNTQELLEELETQTEDEIDVVVSSLGVNDVTSGTSRNKFKNNQLSLYALLANKFSARSIIINSVPPMHEFPALPQPLRWFLGRRAKSLNAVLTGLADSDSKVSFLSLNFPMNDSFFAEDGFHPSKQAYEFWGEELASLIRKLDD